MLVFFFPYPSFPGNLAPNANKAGRLNASIECEGREKKKSFINYIEIQIIVFADTNVPSVASTRILWDNFRALSRIIYGSGEE